MKHLKITTTFLAAAMLFSAVPLTASAAGEPDNIYENDHLKIVFDDIEIPAYENGRLDYEVFPCFKYNFDAIKNTLSGTVIQDGVSSHFEHLDELDGDYFASAFSESAMFVYGEEYVSLDTGENDFQFYFGEYGEGERTSIKINVVQNKQFITDFQISDAVLTLEKRDFECQVTALAHTGDDEVPVSFQTYDYERLGLDESIFALSEGTHTLKARFYDAETDFNLTVKSDRFTDFTLSTDYDTYLDRGAVKFVKLDRAEKPLGACYANLEGNRFEIDRQTGSCLLDSDPWTIGEHQMTVTFCGITKTVTYQVHESVIDHVEAENLYYYEGDNYRNARDSVWGDTHPLYKYFYRPDCTVYYKDGSSVLSNYGRIQDSTKMNIGFDSLKSYQDDQEEHPWGVGVYTVSATPYNNHFTAIPELATTFTVQIEAKAEVEQADANADGKINIADATYVQQFAADLLEITPKQKKAADINGDGEINVIDATLIQLQIAE